MIRNLGLIRHDHQKLGETFSVNLIRNCFYINTFILLQNNTCFYFVKIISVIISLFSNMQVLFLSRTIHMINYFHVTQCHKASRMLLKTKNQKLRTKTNRNYLTFQCWINKTCWLKYDKFITEYTMETASQFKRKDCLQT